MAPLTPTGASALGDGASATPTVPEVASVMVGVRASDASPTNLDRAVLAKLFDRDTGAGTENVLGASIRVGASGGSVEAGLLDNAPFTDGSSPVLPGGFILDEVAGTALSENDVAAARIDSKRAQVMVIEDATTRGQRAAVTAAGEVKITFGEVPGTSLTPYSVHITANTTTTPTSSTAYISCIVISAEAGGTTSTVTIQDKQGTPLKLVNGLTTTAATTGPTVYNFQKPVKMVSGIDIITAGAVAATIDVWIDYYQ